jgi:exonuclease SbcC
MRILAIRGKNLASLADEFEILLDEGVLQTVGLFAITGQTGAGKSTILDALCLALYDKMPRLPDGVGISVGHKDEDKNHWVKHNDVRSILRRGANHAFAEVDFIGKDKQAYRARWQVRKASGKLQAQEMLLSNINSGQQVGQTKKNTLEAISDLLDLSFDQFCRSVLLAQGDFAAFLKAKKNERSSLLERITGTELYTNISIAAFERAKLEKTELDRISALMQHQIPLESAARQELEQQRDVFATSLQELDKQLADNQKIIDWYLELKKRQQAEQLASNALAESSQAWQNAEPLRVHLKQVETAQPLRPLLSHYQQARVDYDDAETKLKAALESQAATETKLHIANTQLNIQNANLLTAETQYQQAQPVLKAIRVLDTRLDVLQTTLNALNNEHNQLHNKLSTAQQQHDTLLKQQAELNAVWQKLNAYLTEQQALELLAENWKHWQSEFARYSELNKQQTENNATAEKIQATLEKDQQRLSVLQTDIETKKQGLHEQQTALIQLKQQESQYALPLLYQTKERLELEKQQLNRAITLSTQAVAVQLAISQDTQRLTSIEQTLETTKQQLDILNQQQTINHISLDEAKKALALIEASSHKDAQQLRTLLIQDQPCPVCGALEHPWQTHAIALNSQHCQAQQQRVDELEQEKTSLTKTIASHLQAIEQHKEQATDLNRKIITAQEINDTLLSDWHSLMLANKPVLALQDSELLPRLTADDERVTADLAQIKQQEKAALAIQQQIKSAQQIFDTDKQAQDALNSEYTALDKQLAQDKTELRACLAAIDHLKNQLNALVDALAVPCGQLDNWQIYLTSPTALNKKTDEFKQNQQELAVTGKKLESNQQQTQLIAQSLDLILERDSLIASCKGDFNHPVSADSIEQQLNQQLELAKTAQKHAANAVNQATSDLASQKVEQQHWQIERAHRDDKLQKSLATLNHALERLAINQDQLSELLQQDEHWLDEQKATIAQLEKALQAATTLLTIKTDDRKQHENQAVIVPEVVALQTASELLQQKQSLSEQKQEYDLQLREDDKKLASNSHFKAELDKQRQRWEQWQSLNELIGSASGAKFRVFAQSLTLEALLIHSNKHLADFAKRYALQRVPNSDLELQIVDKDMADDVRSVHSLSGGESFLVSLALALGLASLSSNKTQVESLFIDEGFGSLDPETLDIAIASLDTLQALGRKVGVISHVPILVERIGAKIVVEKQGGGKSKLTIVGGY